MSDSGSNSGRATASGIGALIIGDEIMRGKRRDRHFEKLVELLSVHGLYLAWVRYLGDDRPRLIDALRASFAGNDVIFSFGGIGITPDDHTRQAAAAARGVELVLHPDAEREIRARTTEMNQEITPVRLDLGKFPVGSRIIPNPYNRIPGFSLDHHHFLPGFPEMAWPMAEWVLETHYRDRFAPGVEIEAAIRVWEGLEGTLLPLMQRIEAKYAGLTVFSLPSFGNAQVGRHVELGVRGDPARVPRAMSEIEAEVARLGYSFERT